VNDRWTILAVGVVAQAALSAVHALVAASSWGVAFGVLTLMPVAGWWLLRQLEDEEEGRLRARTARLARARPANLPAA
jgi:6,7-dimethyl-8-ribityllumazine synthase